MRSLTKPTLGVSDGDCPLQSDFSNSKRFKFAAMSESTQRMIMIQIWDETLASFMLAEARLISSTSTIEGPHCKEPHLAMTEANTGFVPFFFSFSRAQAQPLIAQVISLPKKPMRQFLLIPLRRPDPNYDLMNTYVNHSVTTKRIYHMVAA